MGYPGLLTATICHQHLVARAKRFDQCITIRHRDPGTCTKTSNAGCCQRKKIHAAAAARFGERDVGTGSIWGVYILRAKSIDAAHHMVLPNGCSMKGSVPGTGLETSVEADNFLAISIE